MKKPIYAVRINNCMEDDEYVGFFEDLDRANLCCEMTHDSYVEPIDFSDESYPLCDPVRYRYALTLYDLKKHIHYSENKEYTKYAKDTEPIVNRVSVNCPPYCRYCEVIFYSESKLSESVMLMHALNVIRRAGYTEYSKELISDWTMQSQNPCTFKEKEGKNK